VYQRENVFNLSPIFKPSVADPIKTNGLAGLLAVSFVKVADSAYIGAVKWMLHPGCQESPLPPKPCDRRYATVRSRSMWPARRLPILPSFSLAWLATYVVVATV
jgi:hypothetical protein